MEGRSPVIFLAGMRCGLDAFGSRFASRQKVMDPSLLGCATMGRSPTIFVDHVAAITDGGIRSNAPCDHLLSCFCYDEIRSNAP